MRETGCRRPILGAATKDERSIRIPVECMASFAVDDNGHCHWPFDAFRRCQARLSHNRSTDPHLPLAHARWFGPSQKRQEAHSCAGWILQSSSQWPHGHASLSLGTVRKMERILRFARDAYRVFFSSHLILSVHSYFTGLVK